MTTRFHIMCACVCIVMLSACFSRKDKQIGKKKEEKIICIYPPPNKCK